MTTLSQQLKGEKMEAHKHKLHRIVERFQVTKLPSVKTYSW